jgi:L-threonylcarbamoyladenylate synthase
VEQELSGRIAGIVDGGDCTVGVESTILALDPVGGARVLRPGKISTLDLERILQVPVKTEGGSSRPEAPGMLDQHYAPRKPLYLVPHELESLEELHRNIAVAGLAGPPGLLTQKALAFEPGVRVHLKLSEAGSAVEAARNLFSMLRHLDGDDSISYIIADLPPTPRHGLASAIADRLNRASTNKPLLTP